MNDKLIVLVPSRGRPEAAKELWRNFEDSCASDQTELWVIVDADDPEIDNYPDSALIGPAGNGMVAALNWGFQTVELTRSPFAVGFMGDDHRPRTYGWDRAYLAALRELGSGIVYGNDMFQKGRLPTQCAMTFDIPKALSKMAPAGLRHMYVDNWWRDMGNGSESLRYLPDVIIEHVHPLAGKAPWDDGYRRVNSSSVISTDEAYYRKYVAERLPEDILTIKRLRGAA